MRRWVVLAVVLCGCSTAPVADILDFFKPGKIREKDGAPFGGVCQPQSGAAPGPAVPVGGPRIPPANVPLPPDPVTPPGGIPAAPAPLPGSPTAPPPPATLSPPTPGLGGTPATPGVPVSGPALDLAR